MSLPSYHCSTPQNATIFASHSVALCYRGDLVSRIKRGQSPARRFARNVTPGLLSFLKHLSVLGSLGWRILYADERQIDVGLSSLL